MNLVQIFKQVNRCLTKPSIGIYNISATQFNGNILIWILYILINICWKYYNLDSALNKAKNGGVPAGNKAMQNK